MRVVLRSVMAAVLALLGTVVLAVAWTAATAVHLTATALIMGGTEHPLSTPPDDPVSFVNPYLNNAITEYLNPAAAAPTGTGGEAIQPADGKVYAVTYPAEFFPVFGAKTFDVSVGEGVGNLDNCLRGAQCGYNTNPAVDPVPPLAGPLAGEDVVVYAYSQSAVAASLVKRGLIGTPRDGITSFFLLANAMRPNGGILAMGPQGLTIPILGVTFYGATPTNSCDVGACMPTVDLGAQYDILGGDAPASLTNLLAIANAVAGYLYLHGDLQNASFSDALYQGSHGDTDYYLRPATRLPILMPFAGIVPSPILTLLNAPLQVLIEGAHARDVNPGVAPGLSLLPFRNPIATLLNLIVAIPTGIDDALAELTGNPAFRPLGTTPPTSPFGVGGPDLPAPPTEQAFTSSTARSPASGDDVDGTEVTQQPDVTPDATDEEPVDASDRGPAEEQDKRTNDDPREDDARDDESDESDETDTPKVRGPIEFDSREPTATSSTATPSGTTPSERTPSTDGSAPTETSTGDTDSDTDRADGEGADGEAAA